ncbi:MAG: insulinase family protein [Planctomycetes bacterium]|nr:insulinase family protein [Planctomycetota bacterium]
MSDPYTLHTLDNGLQIVIEQMADVRSAAAGFLVRTGARDETPDVAGISHFLEHMVFKGTAKRSWREITVDFDRMGSTYNAFTSEDRTIFYGWVRKDDITKQIELLADMMRPILPTDEFDTERKVILEEIAMAKDQHEHVAFDFLQEKVFAGHPLAWPILGYDATVAQLSRDRMWSYLQERYTPDNILLVVAGNVDERQIVDTAQKLCGEWTPSTKKSHRAKPTIHDGTDVLQTDRFKQQIIALTFPACGASDPAAETAAAIATILGGENSRFFWNIVQAGLSPRAGAYFLDYTDCGAFMLYGSCGPENAESLVTAMRKEAKLIVSDSVQEHEVDRVKTRRRTSLAMESEAPYYRLTQLMDDMEIRGAPRTVEQMLAEVDAVSADSIGSYFERFPINTAGHLASVGPRHWPNGG